MEITSTSPTATAKLAEQLTPKIKPGSVIALYGDLGSGKTTFTRYLVNNLGSDSRVQSPTFVIARKYKVKDNYNLKIINHLDLYRLKSTEELQDLDLEHYFVDPTAITLIEWPQIAESLLPADHIKINFEYLAENTRKIYVENID